MESAERGNARRANTQFGEYRSTRRGGPLYGDVGWRRVRNARWRRYVALVEQGRRSEFFARSVSGVRAGRALPEPASERPESPLSAEPLRYLPARSSGRTVDS